MNICFSKGRHLEGRLGCPMQICYELQNDQPIKVFIDLGGKYRRKNAYHVIVFISTEKLLVNHDTFPIM
jgi:hypothetical protein